MVRRGGGRKIGSHKIAPVRLWKSAQTSRSNLLKKQNVGEGSNTIHPFMTDEIALVVAKNLERQKKACTTNVPRPNESPNDHVLSSSPGVDDNGANTIVGNEVPNSPQDGEDEETSQGIITPLIDGLLGKRKRESNFVSRIEVGLESNQAFDAHPRENPIRSRVEHVNGGDLNVNTATGKTKGKCNRGMYKSYVGDMKIKGTGSKLKVSIPKDIDRAIGENARHMVNECGLVVRTRAPSSVKSWSEAFDAAGDSMMKEIHVMCYYPSVTLIKAIFHNLSPI